MASTSPQATTDAPTTTLGPALPTDPFVLGLIAHGTRQPIILGYLIAGALVGPTIGFKLIKDEGSVEVISEIIGVPEYSRPRIPVVTLDQRVFFGSPALTVEHGPPETI